MNMLGISDEPELLLIFNSLIYLSKSSGVTSEKKIELLFEGDRYFLNVGLLPVF